MPSTPSLDPGAPRLLDRVRQAIRMRHYSRRTEGSYVAWIRQFIVFHKKTHPSEMGSQEISAFLSWLATARHVSASTQNQALSALLFLYRDVLHLDPGPIEQVARARMPSRLPVVLTRTEVLVVLQQLTGVPWMAVGLLYGAGLRLLECLELRVKDVDFEKNQIVIRRGKGQKDRVTVLPSAVKARLVAHLDALGASMIRICREGMDASYCRLRWIASIRTQRPSGVGSLRSLPLESVSIRDGVPPRGFIFTNQRFSGPLPKLRVVRELASTWAVTRPAFLRDASPGGRV